MEETGFEVKLFSLQWRTKAFNRTLIKWGNSRPHFLNIWFKLGLYFSLALLPVGICLIMYSFFQHFLPNSNTGSIIEPVLPGINLPLSEIFYYSSTLIFCSVVHELGHALSAVSENVHLVDVGVNLWFIIPVAFVNLSSERFNCLSKEKSLKILCAGIWHNLMQSFTVYLLYQALPFIFSLIFLVNSGITITEIAKASPLVGNHGLNIGDTIANINDCVVYDENSWYDCLAKIDKTKPAFCIQSTLIHTLDESIPLKHVENGNIDCCEEKHTNICFEHLDSADGILEIPSHACLPGRYIIEQSPKFCTSFPHKCPENSYCFSPILTNTTNLFKLKSGHQIIIYVGLASDFYKTIEVSSYIPNIFLKSTKVPDVITKFLKYVIIFSLGLAFINILPFKCTDGQYILQILGQIFLEKKYGNTVTQLVIEMITWFFTILLICHCLKTIFV